MRLLQKALVTILALANSVQSISYAESQEGVAYCEITVDDVRRGSKSVIRETFSLIPDADRIFADRRYFALPGVADGRCTLAFFPKNGTMVGCELDAAGWQYVQSDRSGREEFPNSNQLTFRFRDVHISIDVKCSPVQ